MKLDCATPGSDYLSGSKDNAKPANSSGVIVSMHNAIMKYAPGMELYISWGLEREEPFWDLW